MDHRETLFCDGDLSLRKVRKIYYYYYTAECCPFSSSEGKMKKFLISTPFSSKLPLGFLMLVQ